MSNNIKIARKLMKLAKEIMSSENVADTAGEYKGFTGKINFKGMEGKVSGIVKGATFELSDDGRYPIIWKDGIWEHGEWENGKWENGIWKNGEWEDGVWYDGIWEDGEWYNGTWKNGEWKNGIWESGEWYKGTWKNGMNMDGEKHADNPSEW